ncbi:putative cell wall proline rich protein [Aspergillus ibericus CBS 121593]|uniref:Cell wall proline rich protein n=1 Tax=Aspergillus ibericus CBS 121593 TaxID=1448316 RepID=A0A395GT63_9EURO|nr:cell wall proline rich protein [Aspergillus ibericus CBS 121593]RAK98582.1 cell wall proline rich protein [Aspergillus ibericus CBS 121593]
MSAPLPNPPFVFPARDPGDAAPPSSETRTRTALPLPAFSFNPGAQHSAQPSMPTLSPNRPAGHRRRCSELVGGERPIIPPGTMEAIQSNDENPTPAPTKLPAPGPGFGAGGRRHAHRRSAAISSVDLTAISNALDLKPSIGSAPCFPADTMREHRASEEPPRPVSQSAAILTRQSPPVSPRIVIEEDHSEQAQPETPSNGTAPGRQSSETLKSETGVAAASQPEASARNSGYTCFSPVDNVPPKAEQSRPRPRTADASFMLDPSRTAKADGDSPTKRPLSAAGHSRNRKSLSAGILDHFASSSRRSSSSSSGSENSSGTSVSEATDPLESPSSKKRSKAKKRQKKVRSWAGALLIRGKGKRHSKKDRAETKAAIPPVLTRTNSDLGSGLDVDFDDDNIVVLRTPTNPGTPESSRLPAEDTPPSLETSWKPRSFYEQTAQNDVLSPVIDLDAALGPFNTPEMRSGRLAESGFSAATKRMYSGGRRGEFIGPEMRYHRRAESAPEMPPFDRSGLGNNRFATSSTLENPDVLYEEEEDAFLAATGESQPEPVERPQTQVTMSSTTDADSQSEDSKDSSETLTHQSLARETSEGGLPHAGLGIQKDESNDAPESTTCVDREARNSAEQQTSLAQFHHATNPFSAPLQSAAEVVKPEEWRPRPSSPDYSPGFMPADHRGVTSLELTSNIPPLSLQGNSSLPNSSFPSPDFTLSSSDVPRSITTSSTNDRNFSNPSYNPSVDLPQGSVEDVPSLTSSASTTTNTLGRISGTFFSRPRLSTDRSASFSAAVRRRTSQANSSKRSSLASLSKLMVGPHAERSKLSYEEKPPEDEPERAKKKGLRISRLMHFWRAKDKDKSYHEPGVRDQRPS